MKKGLLKRIKAIADKLSELQSELTAIKDDAQDYFDSRSEKWQESEKGETAQEEIERIEEFADEIENINIDIEDFINTIE